MRKLLFTMLALSMGVLTGCWSGGGKHARRTNPIPDGIAASQVYVSLNDRSRGLEFLKAELERAMIHRYRRSGAVAFGQIRFVIDSVRTDPAARQDLWLSGRVIVTTRFGTESRTIERRIHGGASSHPSKWTPRLLPALLNAIDFQLRLLQK